MTIIETKIGDDAPSLAYVKSRDLALGTRRIFVGDITGEPDGIVFVERNMESILVHETSHILIYEVTQSLLATQQFDNADNPWDDSNLYPISRGCE